MPDTPNTQELAATPEPERNMTPIEMVARAAADPNVDADKMGKLYDIADRHQRREAEIQFNRCMMDVQAEVRTIVKNRPNTQTGSSFGSALRSTSVRTMNFCASPPLQNFSISR